MDARRRSVPGRFSIDANAASGLRTALTALVAALSVVSTAVADERKPNVVIFLADDAGWGDYSRNGNTQVATPHIDSIAAEGVTLDRFYVCPLCAPTRAEFLTGRYYPRGGVRGVSTGQERLDLGERTIAEAFKAAGYATGIFGKWHNGTQWPYHPMARGFDEFYGYTSGHWGEYFDPHLEEGGRIVRGKGYIVDLCTDRAIDFIERNRSKPFFCYVPFTTPHSPWGVPDSDWQRFKDKPITQRATDADKEKLDETRCVLAMIENQDRNVGRVLDTLKNAGLADDTIVLFFSDNGPNTDRWNGGMKGKKAGTDEGSVRAPCFIRWPSKLPAGRVVPEITGAIDLLPTLTSLAGIPRIGDKPLDGRDLSPLLLGKGGDWPDRMIFSAWGGVTARTQRHRLDARGQLFDMVADPAQTTPVNDREPQVAEQLDSAVKNWRREMFGEQKPQGRRPGGGNAVDPRPIPVGYCEFPITMLPARDGEPRGTVKRSSAAPNSSYFANWTKPDDEIVWNIVVHTPGRYEVTIDYTCPLSDAGSLVELSHRGHALTGRVTPGWDPPLYDNQDTLPRPPAESRLKEFHTLQLGEIMLDAGEGPLVLRAVEIPGRSVMDLYRLTLRLLD